MPQPHRFLAVSWLRETAWFPSSTTPAGTHSCNGSKTVLPRPWPCIGPVTRALALFAVPQHSLCCTHLRHCPRQPARAAQVNVMHRADGSAPRGWHQLAYHATQAGGTVVCGPSEPDRPAAAAAKLSSTPAPVGVTMHLHSPANTVWSVLAAVLGTLAQSGPIPPAGLYRACHAVLRKVGLCVHKRAQALRLLPPFASCRKTIRTCIWWRFAQIDHIMASLLLLECCSVVSG